MRVRRGTLQTHIQLLGGVYDTLCVSVVRVGVDQGIGSPKTDAHSEEFCAWGVARRARAREGDVVPQDKDEPISKVSQGGWVCSCPRPSSAKGAGSRSPLSALGNHVYSRY